MQDPDRGRPISSEFGEGEEIDQERVFTIDRKKGRKKIDAYPGRTVDVVLSDMCEPWPQVDGFWKRSLSNPHIRMMNTSGINFKDHTGSMVTLNSLFAVSPLLLGSRNIS